ncbi:DUF6262 family protein [Mycobacterium simulans]|uniref:DUF6262 family protein n=1 Tax=Mycobacterium simulans TaxID=627089 RepID=UPI0021B20F5F|nr:DUF6262 family protein [Mycobacterium simulans]
MRPDNSHHLIAAAQRSHADTLQRAHKALHELGETGQQCTVTQIAAHAGVSRSWLYAQPELRDQLRRLTAISEPSASAPARIEPGSGFATPTPRNRARTHSRTRQRNPPTAAPNRAPTRPAPRRSHRCRSRHGHRL